MPSSARQTVARHAITYTIIIAYLLLAQSCDTSVPSSTPRSLLNDPAAKDLVETLHEGLDFSGVASKLVEHEQTLREVGIDNGRTPSDEQVRHIYSMLGTTEVAHNEKLKEFQRALFELHPELSDLSKQELKEILTPLLLSSLRIKEYRISGDRVEGQAGDVSSNHGGIPIFGNCDPASRNACVANAQSSYMTTIVVIEAIYVIAVASCPTTGPGVAACWAAATAVKSLGIADATQDFYTDRDNCYLSFGEPGCEDDDVPGGGSGGSGGDGGSGGNGGSGGSGGSGGTTCVNIHDGITGEYLGTCCGGTTQVIVECAAGL